MDNIKTMFCSCGCNDGVVLKYEKDDDEAWLSLVSDMFSVEQGNFARRFIEKCRRIWAIIRNKEFYYFDVWIKKDELREFKDFVSKM